MPTASYDEFRRKAEECRQKAESAVALHDKEFWLRLAKQWEDLAGWGEQRAMRNAGGSSGSR
jgi:hypothetical protein